jgi:hypothetical protein
MNLKSPWIPLHGFVRERITVEAKYEQAVQKFPATKYVFQEKCYISMYINEYITNNNGDSEKSHVKPFSYSSIQVLF